jgi:hypothetical protein
MANTPTTNLALLKPADGDAAWGQEIRDAFDTIDALFDGTTGNHDHSGVDGHGPKLTQARTHESPDTDAGPTSLHHTLGTGANQAAAGNHAHAASAITSGTLATARLGSGTADGTTFLRGDQTWAVPAGGGGGMSDPMTTAGDIIIRNGSNATARLAAGSNGQVLTVASGVPSWAAASGGFDPVATARIVEEFVGNGTTSGAIGTHAWTGIGGTFASVASVANHPGIIQRSTGGSSGTNASLYLTNAGAIGLFLPADTFDCTWVVRLNTNDANTLVRVGLLPATTSPPVNGLYFEKLDADTNWHRVARASSTETRADTGVAVGTGWVKFRIRRKDASTIGFTVDGGSESDIATNVPTVVLSPMTVIVNSAAAAKTLDHDLMTLDITVTR